MRCEGFHKIGGTWSVGGLPVWQQCKNDAIVMLTVVQNGKDESLPACNECWKESIENKFIEIINVEPLKAASD